MSSSDPGEDADLSAASLRAQLKLVLDSHEFTASRRSSDFLRFVCEAAFAGRTEIDQIEIARALLDRDDSFNPVEDASVRKLATLTRQRLEAYYAGSGKDDPVVIFIPPRSYLPRFRARHPHEPRRASPARLPRLAPWAAACLLVVAAAAFCYRAWPRPEPVLPGVFVIPARLGAINGRRLDAPPSSLLIGGPVGAQDSVTVRMTFIPNEEQEEAGIMFFVDADNYVKLARCFLHRTQFEFVAEEGGKYLREYPASLHYDAEGQTGQPVWLAIRRNEKEFRAYTSGDGSHWRPVGPPLRTRISRQARVAVFAFSAREAPQPAVARFDHLGAGPPIPDWDGTAPDVASLDGWQHDSACSETTASMPDLFQLSFPPGSDRCRWWLRRPAPAGDWLLSAVVDTLSWSRSFAGIDVRGPKGNFSLVCNYSNGGSILIEHPSLAPARRPMLPGSAPSVLRLRKAAGMLTAESGRSLDHTDSFDVAVDAATLGEPLTLSFHAGRGTLRDESVLAPVGFRWAALEQTALKSYR